MEASLSTSGETELDSPGVASEIRKKREIEDF